MRALLLVLVFLQVNYSLAQKKSWRVIDQKSQEGIAFVNVLIDDGRRGTSTDIDGKFSLAIESFDSLSFSAIGYGTKTLKKAELLNLKDVKLQVNAYGLEEVLILPGENPAHRLINLAIENRKINNPELASEFYYESYNKLVFTGELDSNYVDSNWIQEPDSIIRLDDNDMTPKEFLEKQHFFIMESVTERNHIPPSFSKEVVIASRISGLQNPIFSLIGTQLQSFSLYTTYISLFGENYLSPISKGSTEKYVFELRDTLYSGVDTVFTIYFKPRKGKFFTGLKGSLAINTNGYAVQNFIAEPFDQADIPIKIQQKYEFIDNKQWFPVQLNTTIFMKNIEMDGLTFLGIGKSYLKGIELKSRLEKKEIGNTILAMDSKAGKREPSWWEEYRSDSLDSKEQATYHFMDSVGKEANLDRKIAVFGTLMRGSIPWGPIDFPLNRFLDFNGYEGFRLGLGIESNEKFIKWLRLGGYGAYGFRDKAIKYGYHARWTPKSNREFELKASYSDDVSEVGGTQFFKDRLNGFSSEGIQKLFINRMDLVERIQAELSFRALRDFHFTAFANTESRSISNEYVYSSENGSLINSANPYQLTQVGLGIRHSFREKYAEVFGVKTPIISKYPIIHAKFTKGLDGFLEGEYEFFKADIKIDQKFNIRNLGISQFRIAAGYVDNPLPLGLLHRVKGSYDEKYSIASQYSFETAGPNEFYSDRYVNLFFRHSFKDLLFQYKSFKPQISIVSTVGFGSMEQPNRHLNTDFSTFEKGLYESGLQIDNILEEFGLGVGAFYRYGNYAKEEWKDNVALKLTAVFNF